MRRGFFGAGGKLRRKSGRRVRRLRSCAEPRASTCDRSRVRVDCSRLQDTIHRGQGSAVRIAVHTEGTRRDKRSHLAVGPEATRLCGIVGMFARREAGGSSRDPVARRLWLRAPHPAATIDRQLLKTGYAHWLGWSRVVGRRQSARRSLRARLARCPTWLG